MSPRDLTYKLYLGCERGPLRERLLGLLRDREGFRWEDVSPAPDAGRAEMRRRMRGADAVLLVSPEDPAKRTELELARALGRPIIGVLPRGERSAPEALHRVADELVGWSSDLMVDSIRQYALPS
ncbi:MAG TPA: hypothetical protein VFE30_13985 [Anaeromyxobacteraceae bacterium]|jgi:hypothetical protein|nr:hypothetical protein [Anaeromyxobacteraceae bacterium]